MSTGRRLASAATVALLCSLPRASEATKEIGTSAAAFTLTSDAFEHQGDVPALYTCDGKDVSPPLSWSGEPAKARTLALIVEDLEATDAPKRSFVHWIVFDIPVVSRGLREAVKDKADLPAGAREGRNDAKRVGYSGPCPSVGRKHNYLFSLVALDTSIDLDQPTKADLEDAMRGHVLGRTELLGTYERKR